MTAACVRPRCVMDVRERFVRAGGKKIYLVRRVLTAGLIVLGWDRVRDGVELAKLAGRNEEG